MSIIYSNKAHRDILRNKKLTFDRDLLSVDNLYVLIQTIFDHLRETRDVKECITQNIFSKGKEKLAKTQRKLTNHF